MYRFTAALVGALLLAASTAATACTPRQAQALLTGTLYREAHGTLAAQASVASVVFTRVQSPRWPNTICAVITQPNQFEYKLVAPVARQRLALAQERAAIFLREFHAGRITTAAHIFDLLEGYDSFHLHRGRAKGIEKLGNGRIVVADNEFYRSPTGLR
ncbi:MAG: hypothetical protein GC129_06280 [Proteobacteria bacterium]|nr:hypothetical protein [Pseudomonadota bacterium]